MTTEIAEKLHPAGITNLEQLADLATDELVEMTGISEEKAAGLITNGPQTIGTSNDGRTIIYGKKYSRDISPNPSDARQRPA